MKNQNIPANIKSKSLKEAKEEINLILNKLESNDTNLSNFLDEYKRLILLNKHIDYLFKTKIKNFSSKVKKNKNDKK
tara:strand:+ start:1731 stop:1961 length:231 start_codon:yes stop_codon:yes gene_type:complete